MRTLALLALMLGGCSASHASVGGDAGAVPVDAGAPPGDPLLGPPCVQALPAQRPVEVSAGVIELEPSMDFGFDGVTALGATSDGALLLVAGRGATYGASSAWEMLDLDLEAAARAIRVLDPDRYPVEGSGAVLPTAGGEALLAWVTRPTSDAGRTLGAQVSLARVRGHAAPEPLDPVQVTNDPVGYSGYSVMLVAAGDRPVVVTGRDGAVVLSDLGDHELGRMELVADDHARWLSAASLDERRVVLVWRDWGGPIWAAIGQLDSGSFDEPVQVALPTFTSRPASLLVHEGSVYVAYFEDVLDDLWAGRLRVARLDERLQRTQPDRGVTGWGGV